MCAAAEREATAALQEKLGLWLAMTVSAHAPFFDQATGRLQWMEQRPY